MLRYIFKCKCGSDSEPCFFAYMSSFTKCAEIDEQKIKKNDATIKFSYVLPAW